MKKYFIKTTVAFFAILFILSACKDSNDMEKTSDTTNTELIYGETKPQLTTTSSSDEKIELTYSTEKKYEAIISVYQDFIYNKQKDEDALDKFYDKIIDEINNEQEEIEYEVWCSGVEMYNSDLGYAIYDLNNDDICELIILSEDFFVHAIYSLYNDVPVLVGGYWSRKSCVIDETGTLYIHGSSGAADSSSASYLIAPNTTELQLIEMIGIESYDNETGENFNTPQCYRIKNGNKYIIDYEELLIESEYFPNVYPNNITKNAGLPFIPLLK